MSSRYRRLKTHNYKAVRKLEPNKPSETNERATMMAVRSLDFVNSHTLHAKNNWMGVDMATFLKSGRDSKMVMSVLTIVTGSTFRQISLAVYTAYLDKLLPVANTRTG